MQNEVEVIRASVPQARRPDRIRRVDVGGIELSVVEWGRENNPPPVSYTHLTLPTSDLV